MNRREAVAAAADLCGASLGIRSGDARLIQVIPGVLQRRDATGPAYQLTETNGQWGTRLLNAGQLTAAKAQYDASTLARDQTELARIDAERATLADSIRARGGTVPDVNSLLKR